jgi:hypothetical protein
MVISFRVFPYCSCRIFYSCLQNGDMTPKLDKRIIDSLELEMKMNESDR